MNLVTTTLSQNVQVESQQPKVELPNISIDDFDAESMVNDFTDFLVDTQQGRRTSVVSKYQKENAVENALTSSIGQVFANTIG